MARYEARVFFESDDASVVADVLDSLDAVMSSNHNDVYSSVAMGNERFDSVFIGAEDKFWAGIREATNGN